MRKLYSFWPSAIMLILVFSLSCTDHNIPELPDVETLEYGANCHALFTFRVNVRKIGTEPVKEFGVVYIRGTSTANPDLPTVSDTKIMFPNPIKLGLVTHLAGGMCAPLVYYRSYVMLESGVVVYGNLVRFYDV